MTDPTTIAAAVVGAIIDAAQPTPEERRVMLAGRLAALESSPPRGQRKRRRWKRRVARVRGMLGALGG